MNDLVLAKLDRIEGMLETNILPEFMTVKESAALLRCSQSKIRELLRRGELPFNRISDSLKGTVLIKRKDLYKLLK